MPNAHRDRQGHCICDEDWSAADCSAYRGSAELWFITEAANTDQGVVYDYNEHYGAPTGNPVSVFTPPPPPPPPAPLPPRVDDVPELAFMTTGCHPMCATCDGPDLLDCITCNEN
ncbi:MAG: hypothetical protein V2I33_22270, partial [Kangiellaceae bacterium]|nr:hypothetical protein [Kangiellaceae bacterium]